MRKATTLVLCLILAQFSGPGIAQSAKGFSETADAAAAARANAANQQNLNSRFGAPGFGGPTRQGSGMDRGFDYGGSWRSGGVGDQVGSTGFMNDKSRW